MKLNNRFLFGMLSLLLSAIIAFVALPTIARQTNGKTEIVRITKQVLKGEQITTSNTEVVEVGDYNLPPNIARTMDDVKGLYARARRGEVKDFTGISAPFEIPENPALEIDTSRLSLEESVNRVVEMVIVESSLRKTKYEL